jgi:hypothetical protein
MFAKGMKYKGEYMALANTLVSSVFSPSTTLFNIVVTYGYLT